MTQVVIKPVESRGERRQFLYLPWTLYRDDPNWVPPLLTSVKDLAGFRRHPFYQHNDIQTFIATRNGEVCGRIAAIENRAHNEHHDERRGFFGFFESIDDRDVARALFDAGRAWFAGRNLTVIRGPANPSLNYECGLLVDGFAEPPTFMMTYNPPYYRELIEACGLEKSQDMYAYWGHADMISKLDEKLQFMADACVERFDVLCRELDRRRFTEEVDMFLQVYNQSMAGTWGFVPLSPEEIRHMSKEMKYLIEPELTVIAEIEGRVVAAVFCLLDYNERIKHMNGRLLPFNFLKLLRGRHQFKRARALALNVMPEYQKWGLGLVAINRLGPKAIAWGLKECEFSWILESNALSKRTVKRTGGILTKTYRLYDGDV